MPDSFVVAGIRRLCPAGAVFICQALALFLVAGCGGDGAEPADLPSPAPLVVYSAGDAGPIQAVLDAYSAETGVTVVMMTASGSEIVGRLDAEKHQSTADLLLADGIAQLWVAAQHDLLRPAGSQLVPLNIPPDLRDPDKFWFAVLVYGKAIAYDNRATDGSEVTSYAALGEERFRARLCLSSAAGGGNRSLVAMLIAEHGERLAELIVRSWIANLAMPVVADDLHVFREIEQSRCGLGIVSSTAAARHMRARPDTQVTVVLPDAASGGAYIDIVGAAVIRHAGNSVGAIRLLEWLSSEKGQRLLATDAAAYPAARPVPIDDVSPVRLARAGLYLEDAIMLMKRAGWPE